ncbi:helix-turn-helix domain-containing protein [Ruminiclostridium cellulolyticum]|uniref:Transcriptional regulator, XRE family n=1 Tax=Ruminiclostridium cellulolyticum (strain ATCC 35319 / DSM 5812 / JCM 6584 / H10) TaxID=394503 RepID=B8I3W9_RUMCH|nr:helix-turn-helix transcriptional regulator [Ruminiclostridium cellulolyticum]ACL74446.1 transcriptional regulator, XRE family [Ruminiclostridium cellulolyticum H10]
MSQKDKPTFLVLLGKKIRQSRLHKGLTQEDLSEITGLHPSYIGQIERGEKSPSVETLIDISKSLDTSISYILNVPDYKMKKELSDLVLLCSEANKEEIYKITEIAKIILKRT